jgi:formylglycine-generating enzyme required for sulfatase activity
LRKSRVAELRGFYILETEVSQELYGQVMGEGAVDSVFSRLLEADRTALGKEYPIRGVTVLEAAEFCMRLKALDSANPQSGSPLEARRFRLPSHYEWQYACRAIADPERTMEKPHFNAWPSLETIDQAIRADCADGWKKAAKAEPFTGTQEQVLELLKYTEPATAVKILDAFLRAGLGTERSYADTKTPLRPVRTGNPNGWGLYNMHGNVFEWTISPENQSDFGEIVSLLEAGNGEQLEGKNPKAFFLAGGGYNYSLAQHVDGWVKFSIWGGERLDAENAKPEPYAFAELEELCVDNPSGFRIVLERVLAPHWVYAVRDASLPSDPPNLNAVEEKLGSIRETVQELTTSSEAGLALARVNYYQALAEYRSGDVKAASETLTKECDVLAGEDEYFRYLTTLVKRDAEPRL